MKALLMFVGALCVCLSSAFGQSSGWRESITEMIMSDPRFAYAGSEKPPTMISKWDMRQLVEKFEEKHDGSIRLKVPDFGMFTDYLPGYDEKTGSLSVKADDDRSFKFRGIKRIMYRYEPGRWPRSGYALLDAAFLYPVRDFMTRRF